VGDIKNILFSKKIKRNGMPAAIHDNLKDGVE
jgi:hypothetical protein